MSSEHVSTVSRLNGLLEVTRLVRGQGELSTLLAAIARTVADSLGFGTTVINLYRPASDDFEVTTVHGSEAARAELIGTTIDGALWEPLLDERFWRRGAYFIRHGEFDWSSDGPPTFIPDLEATDDPEAWHPEDALMVPMVHSDGHVLGILSVDEPSSGRVPSDEELDVLVAVASHAALAVEGAQEAAALREASEKLRALVQASPVAIIALDRDGFATIWNPAAERMFGWSEQEVLGRPLPYVPAAKDAEYYDLLGRALAGETWKELELARLRKDGSEIVISSSTAPLRDAAGNTVGIVCLMADVTERRQLELKLQQAQKLESLGILAGGIAHDFNNLLVGVLGNAGLALATLPPESPSRDRVEQIEVAARRAAELTRQLLAYAGKGKLVVEPLDLGELVRETAGLLATVVSKRASLVYELAPGLPPVEGDPSQLRQVVMNLITNASEALGSEPGTITLRTGADGTSVFLEVADSGCGMDADTRARIFDPFFTTKFTGRGLGLAAVAGIVHGHGGTIAIETEPGRGSCFRVLLPAAARTAPVAAVLADGNGAQPAVGRVLVVDDEDVVRGVATTILERGGFDVMTASDGEEAVAKFHAHPGEIGVVLLDLTMPGLSGEETFAALRRIESGVRVILTSGYGEEETIERLGEAGVAGFIQKPYRAADLVEKVRAATA